MQRSRTCRQLIGLLGLSSGLLIGLAPAVAHADDARGLLYNYSMTTSAFFEGGATDYGAFRSNYGIAPRGAGIRYSERNGMITGTIGAFILMFTRVAGSVGTVKNERTWKEGDYRYTETTYYSEAEKDERRARASQAGGEQAAAVIGSPTQGFDLMIYSRNLGGDVTGYHATLMAFSLFETANSRLDLGLMFGSVSTATSRDGLHLLTHASTAGIPVRYNLALGPVLTYAEFDWNWYGHGKPKADVLVRDTLAQDVRNMPWHVGASAAVFHRLYLEAAVTTPRLFSGDVGFSSSLGARF